MKRRSFLGGLLGAFVAGPAVAKVAEKALEQEVAIDTHAENAKKFLKLRGPQTYDYKVVSVSEDVAVYINGGLLPQSDYKVVGDKVILEEPLRFFKVGEWTRVDIVYVYEEKGEKDTKGYQTTSTLTITYTDGPTTITVQALPFSRTTSSAESYYLSGALPNPWEYSRA